ncbi:unnamed protein product [Rotaria socialis]|uniref:Uncharacterized protein n=1 Tax=Rotaria socialis TaxID=392032 RepID=A0A821SAZ1_9BILA|nr:unnamed protein product [Rotaria socialis]CAF4856869.1 unnamed protein product [Rotaria socialis]
MVKLGIVDSPHWRSDMDIKFIWTGSDAKALVYYITDYITKASLAFYGMFALAQQGIRFIEQQQATCGTESAIEKTRKFVLRGATIRLLHIKKFLVFKWHRI